MPEKPKYQEAMRGKQRLDTSELDPPKLKQKKPRKLKCHEVTKMKTRVNHLEQRPSEREGKTETDRQRGRDREREKENRKRNNQKLASIVNQLR